MGLSLGRPACPWPRAICLTDFCAFFLLSFGVAILYILIDTHTYIYKGIGKLVPLHPCVPVSPTTMSRGRGAQGRHAVAHWWRSSTIDCHDCVFPGKGIVSLKPGSSSSSVIRVRDPEIMKLFIMPQSLSLCLTRYAWFGHASSRNLFKWSIGGLA
jgi:hypothetical protein